MTSIATIVELNAAPAIRASGVTKRYGAVQALRGVDLEVARGEAVAILGPNGAGKTSLIELLEGFRRPDEGTVRVLDEDPAGAGAAWRERVGVVLQNCRLQSDLSVREMLRMYAAYYRRPRGVDEVVDAVGLGDAAGKRTHKLSGGQLRRLDVGLALIGDPEVLFLDEPTTGFDPEARRGMWEVLGHLQAGGTTLVLTTHYLDEAQALADRLVVLAGGRVVADGAPDDIGGRRDAPAEVRFRPSPPVAADALAAQLGPVHVADDGRTTIRTSDPVGTLARLTAWAQQHGVELDGLETRRPTLEDIYLELTRSA